MEEDYGRLDGVRCSNMAYTAGSLKVFLGRTVHVRLYNGREYRGPLQEIREEENVVRLGQSIFLRIDFIESIFWCPMEDVGGDDVSWC